MGAAAAEVASRVGGNDRTPVLGRSLGDLRPGQLLHRRGRSDPRHQTVAARSIHEHGCGDGNGLRDRHLLRGGRPAREGLRRYRPERADARASQGQAQRAQQRQV